MKRSLIGKLRVCCVARAWHTAYVPVSGNVIKTFSTHAQLQHETMESDEINEPKLRTPTGEKEKKERQQRERQELHEQIQTQRKQSQHWDQRKLLEEMKELKDFTIKNAKNIPILCQKLREHVLNFHRLLYTTARNGQF